MLDLCKKFIFPLYAKHNVTHIFANEGATDMFLSPLATSSLALKGDKYFHELSARNPFYSFLRNLNVRFIHQLVVKKGSLPEQHTISVDENHALNLPVLLGNKGEDLPNLQTLQHLALKIKSNFKPEVLKKFSGIPEQATIWRLSSLQKVLTKISIKQ